MLAQTVDKTIATFDTATGAGTDNTAGTGIGWGSSTWTWDGVEGNPAGAVLITCNFSSASDTPLRPRFCVNGGNPWYNAGTVAFSLYNNIQFDIKWDNTSDLTIDQFNSPTSWPLTITNAAGELLLNAPITGATGGMDVMLCGPGGNQGSPFITNIQMPAAASNGWVHVTIPINSATVGLDGQSGITFGKWVNNYGGQMTASIGTAKFWIDNIILGGTAGPPPPPTMGIAKAGPSGVQITADNNTDQWQRNGITTPAGHGPVLWTAQGSYPVTYSCTIADFPANGTHTGFEAHLYLVNGDTSAGDTGNGAVDWNAPNIFIFRVENLAVSGARAQIQWKTNAPSSNATNIPVIVDAASALGTWSVTFTDSTHGSLSGPGITTTNFTLPDDAVANNFSPVASYLQFGMFKNDGANDGHNNQVSGTFSQVQFNGAAGAFSDTFNGATLTNNYVWRKTSASAVQHIPAGTAWMVDWTVPATGFNLQSATSVNGPWSAANATSTYASAGKVHATVGSAANFFRVIKRPFSQLQVLLPGESNAPNTVSGKTGTPDAQSAGVPFVVTVNAVDAVWNVVSSSDTLSMTSTDPAATDNLANLLPSNVTLSSGTTTFTVSLNTSGSQTITATDTTDGTKTPGTSTAIVIP